jgi:hypothetical protein
MTTTDIEYTGTAFNQMTGELYRTTEEFDGDFDAKETCKLIADNVTEYIDSLLTSLSLCEKTLGEYADEGNWDTCECEKCQTRQSVPSLYSLWNGVTNGYEPAQKTLDLIRSRNEKESHDSN